MANVIMNVYKGQRMDITAQMRDADAILDVFRKHEIKFDKKYTTLNGKGPSTITFKGLKAERYHSDLTKMIIDLDSLAENGSIGNVYVKLTSFVKMQQTPEGTKVVEPKAAEEETRAPEKEEPAEVPQVTDEFAPEEKPVGDVDGDETEINVNPDDIASILQAAIAEATD